MTKIRWLRKFEIRNPNSDISLSPPLRACLQTDAPGADQFSSNWCPCPARPFTAPDGTSFPRRAIIEVWAGRLFLESSPEATHVVLGL